MKYDANIHHRRSIRFKDYDYSQTALYFTTICTKNKQCFFGDVANKEMSLNNAGEAATRCWLEITSHYPNTVLHEFIVMPNHVHGIIQITDSASKCSLQQNKFQKTIPRSIGSIVKGYKIGVTKWLHSNTQIQTVWQRSFYEHIFATKSLTIRSASIL